MKNSLKIKATNSLMTRFFAIQKAQVRKISLRVLVLTLLVFVNIGATKALPSYARQTGMSCSACHFSFPELNSFGRQFKMNGYVLTGMSTIESTEDSSRITRLKLLSTLPLSAMVQSSFTHIEKSVPGVQNNSVTLPQQLSVFYAGQVTPHIGTFIQMTYDGHSFGMDNVDIRYANQAKIGGRNITYGLTLNNNPAVQDVWNTSPAWRFPSAGSDAAQSPAKSSIIENLGTQVAGLGAYTLYNNFLFAEMTVYRSAQQGAANPSNTESGSVIQGATPYWRLALQHQWGKNYLELGTFGIAPKLYSAGIEGPLDKFTDVGFDCQYEHNLSFGAYTFHSSLIKETEYREQVGAMSDKLNFTSLKVDGNLYLRNGLGGTLGYFYTKGSVDDKVASWTNKPDSNGFIAQLEYLPWYNTKFALQYVAYKKFDGTVTNYDTLGRSASDNSTLYLLVWLNF
jgi:hypothetical protein